MGIRGGIKMVTDAVGKERYGVPQFLSLKHFLEINSTTGDCREGDLVTGRIAAAA